MSKWIYLAVITAFLLIISYFFSEQWHLHPAFNTMVAFFAAQAFILFRLDHWLPNKWEVQLSLVKIVIRFLTSLFFILALFFIHTDLFNLVVQFIALYLAYMIFEIVIALTNLRRN